MTAMPVTTERVALPDGCRLHVERRGEGPPVLLLHAGGEDASGWAAQSDAFARAGFGAIAYDRRGTGRSDRDGWPADGAPAHARDAAELLRALDLGPVLALGVSSGAFVALDLALTYPELVELAVVHEPPGFHHVPGGLAHFERLRASAAAALERSPGDYAGAYRAFLEDAHGAGAVERMPPAQWAMEADNAESFLRDDLPVIALRRYSDEELAAVRGRVHLTAGSTSADFLRDVAASLARGGGWSHELLDGQGHSPQHADPAAFVAVLAARRGA